MRAVERHHSPTPEEIMEYLDGEGSAAARDAVGLHLAACGECQAIAASHDALSRDVRRWTIEQAPRSLITPAAARGRAAYLTFLRRPQAALVTFAGAAAVLVAVAMTVPAAKRALRSEAPAATALTRSAGAIDSLSRAGRGGPGGSDRAGAASPAPLIAGRLQVPESAAPARTPSIIRTAVLRIAVKDFADVRNKVDGVVAAVNGFADVIAVTGDASTLRQLNARLRVPADRLTDALARLRALGIVVEDMQRQEDVTDQVVDLDARLANARATEKRLTDILQNRTGRLSDVLDVERELARVRLDIERLDGEKIGIGRRVTYATIDLTVAEERKPGLDRGALPLASRIRIAALDGVQNAVESAAAALLFVLRAGPALALWAVLAAAIWWTVRTLRRPRASE